MTTEEKAKAYDKAIEKIKYVMGHGVQPVLNKEDLQDIFPELKESEDERVRKGLIKAVAGTFEGSKLYGSDVTREEALSWLEKQGKNKGNNKLIWKHWSNGIAGNGDGEPIYLIKTGNTYSLSSCLGFECDYIELSELDNLMLEKQGEQKPADTLLWHPADGDYLPEIDREVIVLLTNDMVCFAHRPNPNGWDGKSVTTGKVEHYTPKTYDKGGWNIPDVKYWLDLDLPNEE